MTTQMTCGLLTDSRRTRRSSGVWLAPRRRVRRPATLLLTLAVCAACCCPTPVSAADDAVVGFVMRITGKWILVEGNKKQAIAGGQQLHGGVVIRPEKAGDGSFLVLCHYDGSTSRYEKEQTLPPRKKENAPNRFFAAVAGRYRGSAQQAASRGNDHLISDGVVLLKEKQADLAPLLNDLPDGSWSIRIRQFAVEGQADGPDKSDKPDVPIKDAPVKKGLSEKPGAVTVTVNWRAGETAVAEVADLQPGLYELQIINPRTKRAVGSSAIAFFCSADTYEKHRAAYKAAGELTESWTDEIQDSVAVPFLRAFLEDLAGAGR